MSRPPELETIFVHGSYVPQQHNRSRMVPIYQTAAFCYDSADHAARLFSFDEPGYIYSRLSNPTVDEAERRIALAEGGIGAVGFASGMAALTGLLLNCLRPGDEILAADCLYGGSWGLLSDTLPTFGIRTRFFNPADMAGLRRMLTPAVRMLLVENLANPRLVVPDLAAIAAVAREARVPLLVDNTLATPWLCRPIEHGADLVLHSCTKYLEGHGSIIGGMVVDAGSFTWDRERYPALHEEAPGGASFIDKFGPDAFLTRLRGKVLMNTGAPLPPLHAFLLIHGLESLHVRMQRHCENATALAARLAAHPAVAWVCHPSLAAHPYHAEAGRYLRSGYYGALLGFGLQGGYTACVRFIDRIRLLTHGTNIGDTKTLVIHPASTTHRNMALADRAAAGIGEDFLRVSVGLEHVDDLAAAIDEAIAAG
jgi:O-acetylhomoserine (thiol)-lyase